MLAAKLNKAWRLVFDRIETTDPRRRRLAGILQGVITNLGNKAIGMAVSFLSVPLTISYLGPERYGVWVTLGSLLAWLALTDFGLGNGLGNVVTAAAGQDRPDLVRMHLSNGGFLLIAVAGAVGLVAVLAWPFIDWNALLGVTGQDRQAEISQAAAITLAIFLLKFPLSLTGKVFLAYQEGRIGNYWGMAGNVASLIVLLIVVHFQGGLVLLALAVSGASLLTGLASTAWVFWVHRPNLLPSLRCIDFHEMRQLGHIGGKFFLIQIMALVAFQTDNLVISHYLGAKQVPSYSLTYTLFSYTGLLQGMLFSYLWAAYTEAIARGDIDWVRRIFRMNLAYGLAFAAVAVAGLSLIAQPFITWWAGAEVAPSMALIGWMACWALIDAFCQPHACLLAASSRLQYQIIYSSASTLSNLVLSIYLVQIWGVPGVIAASVMSYLIFICIPAYIDVSALIRKLYRQLPA